MMDQIGTGSDDATAALGRARALAPEIAALAERIEAERRLPDPRPPALRDAGPRKEDDGTPAIRTALFPAAQARMTDIWQVIGLRGTASDAFAVDDLFVPADCMVARDDQASRREAGPLYCFPTSSLYAVGFAGVALGIARAMLHAFLALARDKTPRGFKSTLRENAVIQAEIARAEARLGAARYFLLGSLQEIWRDVAPSNRLGLAQRMRIRLAATYALDQAPAVVD